MQFIFGFIGGVCLTLLWPHVGWQTLVIIGLVGAMFGLLVGLSNAFRW